METPKNRISMPMQYDRNALDKIKGLNNSLKESEVTSFFGALTQDTRDALGFENYRDAVYAKDIETIEDLAEYTKHAQSLGIEFQYCINAGKTMCAEELYKLEPKIHRFCEKLLKNGITILKVGNLLLFDYIHSYYGSEFKYYLSTTKEYSGVLQYQRLFSQHPEIEEICLPTDLNKNKKFIMNLSTSTAIRIELMVNEGCMFACPWRKDHTPHSSETHTATLNKLIKEGKLPMPHRMVSYYTGSCHACREQNRVADMFLRKTIMPWEVGVYNGIGVNCFKFAGRDMKQGYLLNTLEMFLRGIEDFDVIKDLPWNYFNNYSFDLPAGSYVTIKDMYDYYPKLTYFFEKSGSCADTCGASCHYCTNLAKDAIGRFGEKALFPHMNQ